MLQLLVCRDIVERQLRACLHAVVLSFDIHASSCYVQSAVL